MNNVELHAQLARALGRHIDSAGEMRLALIMGAVVAALGPAAAESVTTACAIYAALMDEGKLARAPSSATRPPGR